MSTIKKINLILKKTNISKVNLAKYLGVSRQMVYNYLDSDDLSKMPPDKCQQLFRLLEVKNCDDILKKELTTSYLQSVSNKIFSYKKVPSKKEKVIELSGLKKEEQDLISEIVFILREILNEDKTKNSVNTLKYLYHFLQGLTSVKELKYILGFVAKNNGYVKADKYDFNEEQQFIFESIMYSAMNLYNNGGASRSKLAESHKRWEADMDRKMEEKLSRTQELNTAKVQALSELGYDEINETNASEVFDKIAEIQARNTSNK